MVDLKTESASIKVFLQSIGALNSGTLIGEWVILPREKEELVEIIEGINEKAAQAVGYLSAGDEIEVGDYMTDMEGLNEHICLTELDEMNRIANEIEKLNVWQVERLASILPVVDSFDEALNIIDEVVIIKAENEAMLAGELFDKGKLPLKIPESFPLAYVDWNSIGLDLVLSGDWKFNKRGEAVCL